MSILAPMLPSGGQFQMAATTAAAVTEQVELIRRVAGTRLPAVELNVLIQQVAVTGDLRQASEDLSRQWQPLSPEQVCETPYLLIGSLNDIGDTLQARRDRWGISYVVVFERDMEAFSPVVARLAGQ